MYFFFFMFIDYESCDVSRVRPAALEPSSACGADLKRPQELSAEQLKAEEFQREQSARERLNRCSKSQGYYCIIPIYILIFV